MDEGSRFARGWRDIRSCEWPRVRDVFDTAVNEEYGGRWDIRFHGWPKIQFADEFDAMDMVNHMVFVCGLRHGSYHVDSERIQ